MRKIFATTLAIVLALSLLTACGGGNTLIDDSAPPAGNYAAPAENDNTGEPADIGEPVDVRESVDKILALMEGEGYHLLDDKVITEGAELFGSAACLIYTDPDLGMLQIYFYPSAYEAAAGKSSIWDHSAEMMERVCNISENFVYIGDGDFVAALGYKIKES